MEFGTSIESINEAESKLGIVLPNEFKESLMIYNGLDYSDEWQIFSVFDMKMKSKSFRNDIVQENNKSRFPYMDKKLVMIGANAYGDNLVFNIDNPNEILIWNHERNKTSKSLLKYSGIIKRANAKFAEIQKKINKSKDKNLP